MNGNEKMVIDKSELILPSLLFGVVGLLKIRAD